MMTTTTIGKGVFRTLMAGVVAIAAASSARAEDAKPSTGLPPVFQETPAQHDARMQWFRDAKFGMFIHWGLYSQLAGEWQDKSITGGAEWIQSFLNIPSSQYTPLAKTWNPSKYHALEWVRLMKAAGIKYICITTKHHDGFCLWPTKMNDDWNIRLTPGGQDLIKPLAEACPTAPPTSWRPNWPSGSASFFRMSRKCGSPVLAPKRPCLHCAWRVAPLVAPRS